MAEARVFVEGDMVRHPAGPWTVTVHALLRHLRSAGIAAVPEPLGAEGEWELLRFLPGAIGCVARERADRGEKYTSAVLTTLMAFSLRSQPADCGEQHVSVVVAALVHFSRRSWAGDRGEKYARVHEPALVC